MKINGNDFLKKQSGHVLFQEKENVKYIYIYFQKEQKKIQANCYIYETVVGEIDGTFHPGS